MRSEYEGVIFVSQLLCLVVSFIKPFYSKYLMYISATTGHNDEPIAKPSAFWYMLYSSEKNVASTQNVNISFRIFLGIVVRSSRKGFYSNRFRIIDRALSVGILVNGLPKSETPSDCYGWQLPGVIIRNVLNY